MITMRGVRFARDVEVSGRTTMAYDQNDVAMSIRVNGPGAHDGTLTAQGRFGAGAPFKAFDIKGEIGGTQIHVRVPAN